MTPVAISKLLEMIGRSAYILARQIATAPDSDINQTAGSHGHPKIDACMHATVCLLRAGQSRYAGDAAKSGRFIGQFSCCTCDTVGVRGLLSMIDDALFLTRLYWLTIDYRDVDDRMPT